MSEGDTRYSVDLLAFIKLITCFALSLSRYCLCIQFSSNRLVCQHNLKEVSTSGSAHVICIYFINF